MGTPPDEIQALARRVVAQFESEPFQGFGYSIRSEPSPRFFQRWNVLCEFEDAQASRTLSFLIAPTDRAEPAYKRSPSYDLVYFSEDVPDERQDLIFKRDRAMIDAFVQWVMGWDKPTSPPTGSP